MPVHDWTRVDSGLFHDFHQRWTVSLSNVLNTGVLPEGYFALVEQRVRGPIPDVLALRLGGQNRKDEPTAEGGVAVANRPPQTRIVRGRDVDVYAARANRVTIRHRHGEIVSVVEIVPPGNKGSRAEFRNFLEKALDLVRQGIHLMVIDVFPPTPRDPKGIHHAIWEEFGGDEEPFDGGVPLTLASYDAGPPEVAYVRNVAVGQTLPDMPLFLRPEVYISTPLERAYADAWADFPAAVKSLLDAD
ncbi:MAG: DUF4058 family protein [Planctomycetota bacterium]